MRGIVFRLQTRGDAPHDLGLIGEVRSGAGAEVRERRDATPDGFPGLGLVGSDGDVDERPDGNAGGIASGGFGGPTDGIDSPGQPIEIGAHGQCHAVGEARRQREGPGTRSHHVHGHLFDLYEIEPA